MQFTEHRQNDHYYCTKKEGNIQNPPPQHIALESQSNIVSYLSIFFCFCLFVCTLLSQCLSLCMRRKREYVFRPPQPLKLLFSLLFVDKVHFQIQIFGHKFFCPTPPKNGRKCESGKTISKKLMQIILCFIPCTINLL